MEVDRRIPRVVGRLARRRVAPLEAFSVTIEPIADQHLEQFRSAVDAVARERLYLGTAEGFSLEQVKEFTTATSRDGGVQLVVLSGGRVVGW